MKRKQILAVLAGFTGSLILCLGLANVLYADDKTEQMQKRLEALEKLTKTLQIVEQYYVDEQNISDLVDKSLSGLLTNLDAHSSFLNEKDMMI